MQSAVTNTTKNKQTYRLLLAMQGHAEGSRYGFSPNPIPRGQGLLTRVCQIAPQTDSAASNPPDRFDPIGSPSRSPSEVPVLGPAGQRRPFLFLLGRGREMVHLSAPSRTRRSFSARAAPWT